MNEEISIQEKACTLYKSHVLNKINDDFIKVHHMLIPYISDDDLIKLYTNLEKEIEEQINHYIHTKIGFIEHPPKNIIE